MAIIIHEFIIPTPDGSTPRYQRTYSMTVGAQVLGIASAPGDASRLVVRGDTAAAPMVARFSLVKADIPLSPAEQAAPYVGDVLAYAGPDGCAIYHMLGPG